MRFLLDTHVFLWAKTNDARMSRSAWAILHDPGNELYLSAITVAEIAIKSAAGKLTLSLPIEQLVLEGMRNSRIIEAPFRAAHAIRLAQ